MIAVNVPLRAGTLLAHVQYAWSVGGVQGSFLNSGITQPDPNFPVFRIYTVPPSGAESLLVSDSTDATNYNLPYFQLD
jgi:hypothetical protein